MNNPNVKDLADKLQIRRPKQTAEADVHADPMALAKPGGKKAIKERPARGKVSTQDLVDVMAGC